MKIIKNNVILIEKNKAIILKEQLSYIDICEIIAHKYKNDIIDYNDIENEIDDCVLRYPFDDTVLLTCAFLVDRLNKKINFKNCENNKLAQSIKDLYNSNKLTKILY
jgi:hypothetical protein